MKLYKFRSLTSEEEFERATQIIETGIFWCSKFSELNDPMEGVFRTSRNSGLIQEIYAEKISYKILEHVASICEFLRFKRKTNS